ncbi:jg10546, partial [Pararge aegeria aegeria]
CPKDSGCIQLRDQSIVCTDCPAGYAGPRCEVCADGHFGDPTGQFGPPKECEECQCNGNVDPNAVGNCNRTTGECLKCIYNTAGEHCDKCLSGFFGDALLQNNKGDCKRCECHEAGTLESSEGSPQCDGLTGHCACRPRVIGKNCDMCEVNISLGQQWRRNQSRYINKMYHLVSTCMRNHFNGGSYKLLQVVQPLIYFGDIDVSLGKQPGYKGRNFVNSLT